MLQVLHLDVSKVDRVLHLAPSSPSAASTFSRHLLGIQTRGAGGRRPPPLLLDAGGASWDGAAGDGPPQPRVHAGARSLCSVTWRRDRCARFFCFCVEIGRLLFLDSDGPELRPDARRPIKKSTYISNCEKSIYVVSLHNW